MCYLFSKYKKFNHKPLISSLPFFPAEKEVQVMFQISQVKSEFYNCNPTNLLETKLETYNTISG